MRRFLVSVSPETAVFAPLIGIVIGTFGAAVYWLAVQLWPTSVAVILSMAAAAILTEVQGGPATRSEFLIRVFYLLIKYNALMALSAAKLPFAVPVNVALGLIMICGYAASFALIVAVMTVRPENPSARVGSGTLALALLVGFVPAALLGIPGLIGLALGVIAGMVIIASLRFQGAGASSSALGMTQLAAELCFYLGALASWSYV
jgi:adenosylcobinamide-GDP ribazoletransferase